MTRGCFPTIDPVDVENSLPHSHGELLMMAPQTELMVGTPWRRIVGFDGIATDSRVFIKGKDNHSKYHDLPYQKALALCDIAWLTKNRWNPRGAAQAENLLVLCLRNHGYKS